MEEYFEALIKWISAEEGGRKELPRQGTRYCPIIRLTEEKNNVDWSIDFVCPDFSESSEIEFEFLADRAPRWLVKTGIQYGLYEGRKKVAEIVVTKKIMGENRIKR